MTDKAGLFCDVLLQLSGQTKVAKILPQSEGIEHGKEIVQQVPGWDVYKGH